MYSQKVIKIFQEAKNAGTLKGANGVGQVGNLQCGDIMKLYILVDSKQVITDARFKTFGCVSAIASTDVACDLIKGKTLEQALKVTNKDVLNVLGDIPHQKIHCSVLAQEAIGAAVTDYHKRQAKLDKSSKKK